MTFLDPISTAADRVVTALIAGLELEFGHTAGEALARRFLEAEEADFHWQARLDERWIGSFDGAEDDDLELDSVSILGCLGGKWFVAWVIVDGDGNAHGMMGKRSFPSRNLALKTFADG